jgi:hypothetical protein
MEYAPVSAYPPIPAAAELSSVQSAVPQPQDDTKVEKGCAAPPTAVVMVTSTPATVATVHTNSLGQRYMMLTSVDIEGAAAADTPPERRLYSVKKCCCGMSLATGVQIIALIEIIGSLFSILTSCMLLYAEANKNKIDHAIMSEDKQDQEQEVDSTQSEAAATQEEPTAEEKVQATNRMIDAGFYAAPFIILVALVGLYFSCIGLKGARGDASASRRYASWKRFLVLWACVSVLFSLFSPGSLLSLFVAMYFFVVVRSHAIECTRLELEQAAAQSAV